jgi:hypothetical protein
MVAVAVMNANTGLRFLFDARVMFSFSVVDGCDKSFGDMVPGLIGAGASERDRLCDGRFGGNVGINLSTPPT